MNKQEVIIKFNSFRKDLPYRYGRSYFTDEVASIVYQRDFTMQMVRIKSEELKHYSEFSNYNSTIVSNKIQPEEFIKIVVIRHFDIYIEFLLTDNEKKLKGNIKNKPLGSGEINKLSNFDIFIFLKGQLFNPENIFSEDEYIEIVNRRKPVIGSWICNDFKIYLKEDNQLVYIKEETVLFGNYYFIDNFLQFYFDNAKEYGLPEALYYEFEISEHGILSLTNESYRHFYNLEKT